MSVAFKPSLKSFGDVDEVRPFANCSARSKSLTLSGFLRLSGEAAASFNSFFAASFRTFCSLESGISNSGWSRNDPSVVNPNLSLASSDIAASSGSSSVTSLVPLVFLPPNTSTSPCKIAPAPPPIAASSSTPASTSSFSGLYPRSLRFCRIAAAPSCSPSATPVPPALSIRSPILSIDSGPSLSNTLLRPGILLNTENTLPRGAISVAPINVPLNAALLRSASVAP